jgi:phospholipase A1
MTETKRRITFAPLVDCVRGHRDFPSRTALLARLRPRGEVRRANHRASAGRLRGARLAIGLAALLPCVAHAQLARCAAIADDRARLACFDALARGESPPAPPHENARPTQAAATPEPPATELEQRWELTPALRRGTFQLRPYRALYGLVHYTTNIDREPSSPTRPVPTQDIGLDKLEAKMQLSLKTKLAEDILGTSTDAWFGYTQQSYWQAANTRFSSPFRETDYEPEAIFMHPLSAQWNGIHARYAALSLTHQSNGRGESLSRSWNRVIGELALESGPWSLQLRPWVRIHERSGEQDDNPDIDDFIGRGEAIAVYRWGGHVVTLMARHTLRGGDRSRGAAQLDWAFPLTGSLNGHVQVFSGYGESLIDYNHRQTSVGVGVSFFD